MSRWEIVLPEQPDLPVIDALRLYRPEDDELDAELDRLLEQGG